MSKIVYIKLVCIFQQKSLKRINRIYLYISHTHKKNNEFPCNKLKKKVSNLISFHTDFYWFYRFLFLKVINNVFLQEICKFIKHCYWFFWNWWFFLFLTDFFPSCSTSRSYWYYYYCKYHHHHCYHYYYYYHCYYQIVWNSNAVNGGRVYLQIQHEKIIFW